LLAENPMSRNIKPSVGANRVANKMPFTDDEICIGLSNPLTA